MVNNKNIELSHTLNVVSKNIKHFRVLKNMSQTELGLKANVAPNYITYIENCNRDFHISTLVGIAKGLEVPMHELFVEDRKEYLSKPRIDKK